MEKQNKKKRKLISYHELNELKESEIAALGRSRPELTVCADDGCLLQIAGIDNAQLMSLGVDFSETKSPFHLMD